MKAKDVRDDNGKFPAYAWPGGYPLYYVMQDGGTLCPPCANRENASIARIDHEDPQWNLVYVDTHWEGEPLTCDHCNAAIPSAYGDPDADEEKEHTGCPGCNSTNPYHNAQHCERPDDDEPEEEKTFSVIEHFNGFSLTHNASGKTHWLSDGVDVFEDLSPGEPGFIEAWEDSFNADVAETLDAYFPELNDDTEED